MRSAIGAIQRLGKDHYKVSIEGERGRDGRRRRITKTVRGTRDEAEVVLARLKLDAGKAVHEDITVSQYWSTFYEPSLARLAPSTANGYRHQYGKYVEPLFGKMKMGDAKARDIERKLASIEMPGAQHGAFKLMRQMFNEAYRDELIDENPFMRRIRLKRMEAYEPEVLLLEDVPKWLEAVHGCAYEPVLLCMLFSGMRREEACALFWSDFEFGEDACAVRIDKTLTEVCGKIHEGRTKTAHSKRTVFMAGYPALRLAELEVQGPLCPLVPDANGHRMAPGKISKEYRKIVEKSGAKYVPMKNLRTSYATIMQGLGASDSLISKSLGHTQIMTDYAHYFAPNAPAHLANARMLGDSVGNFL